MVTDGHAIFMPAIISTTPTLSPSTPTLTPSRVHLHWSRHIFGLETAGANMAGSEDTSVPPMDPPPRVLVLCTVSEIGLHTLRHTLPRLRHPQPIHFASRTYSSIQRIASLAAGVEAQVHGVIQEQWQALDDATHTPTQSAFDPSHLSQSYSVVASIADLLMLHTEGQALIISVAGQEQMAWAFSVHPNLYRTVSKRHANVHAYTLGTQGDRYISLGQASVPALHYDINELQAELNRGENPFEENIVKLCLEREDLSVHIDGPLITVHYLSSDDKDASTLLPSSIIFNLHIEADKLFFTEIYYALTLMDKIQTVDALKPLIHDSTPDLLSFHFVHLRTLLHSYGPSSPQFIAGAQLLHACMAAVHALIQHAYNEADTEQDHSPPHTDAPISVHHTLYLGSSLASLLPVDLREARKLLHASKVDDKYWPQLYVAPDQVKAVCQHLQTQLAAFQLIAYCPSAHIPVAASNAHAQAS